MSKKHEQSATFHVSTSRLVDAHLRVCPGYSFSLDGLYFEGNRRAKPSPEYGTNLDMAKSLSVIRGAAMQSGMMGNGKECHSGLKTLYANKLLTLWCWLPCCQRPAHADTTEMLAKILHLLLLAVFSSRRAK